MERLAVRVLPVPPHVRDAPRAQSLNQHLRSAAHADKIYRGPRTLYGCGAELCMLSAFRQHVESEL